MSISPALNFWNVLEFPHIYLPPRPSNKKKLDDGIFPKQSRPKIPKLQNKKAAMMLTFPRRGIELKTVFTRTSWMDGFLVDWAFRYIIYCLEFESIQSLSNLLERKCQKKTEYRQD